MSEKINGIGISIVNIDESKLTAEQKLTIEAVQDVLEFLKSKKLEKHILGGVLLTAFQRLAAEGCENRREALEVAFNSFGGLAACAGMELMKMDAGPLTSSTKH